MNNHKKDLQPCTFCQHLLQFWYWWWECALYNTHIQWNNPYNNHKHCTDEGGSHNGSDRGDRGNCWNNELSGWRKVQHAASFKLG